MKQLYPQKSAWRVQGLPIRHFLTERYRNWISWYLDVSPSWCRHFQYLGFLTGAPTTNFARKRVKTRSQVQGGSHLSCESISVTVVRRPVRQCIMLTWTRLIQSIWFAGEIFSTHVHNTPPGLASSFPLDRNFSKGGMFSNKNFPEVAPQKNVSAYSSPNYYTAPVPSLKPWSRSSGCVFDIYGQWWPGAYMNAGM